MLIEKTDIVKALKSLSEKADTPEEFTLLEVLSKILDHSATLYNHVDLTDELTYMANSAWVGTEDVLEQVEQYYNDEEVFEDNDKRRSICEEISHRIDWEDFVFELNRKGSDMICQAIDDWLYDKEGK